MREGRAADTATTRNKVTTSSLTIQLLCDIFQNDYQQIGIDKDDKCIPHLQMWWRFGAVGSDVGRINEVTLRRTWLVLGGQLSLAIPSWVGAMSTGQRAVMLCDWGVKADMVLFAGNTVWSDSYLSALEAFAWTRYTNRRLLYFTLLYFALHSFVHSNENVSIQ